MTDSSNKNRGFTCSQPFRRDRAGFFFSSFVLEEKRNAMFVGCARENEGDEDNLGEKGHNRHIHLSVPFRVGHQTSKKKHVR